MSEELLTIAELAERAGVAENTARRYVRLFEEFFAGRQSGRSVRYPDADSPLLALISSCYREGLAAPEIMTRLEAVAAVRGPVMAQEPPAQTSSDVDARLAALEELRREFGMMRDTVGVLWREHRGWKESAAVLDVLAREVAVLRGEMIDLRRTAEKLASRVTSLTDEVRDDRGGREGLEADVDRLAGAQARLAERLDRLAEAVGPDEEFLMLPLVFRSERGEFLGVSANPRKHFSLTDFLSLIDQGAAAHGSVATQWAHGGEDCWVLCITEGPGRPLERRHQVRVRRTATPRGNTVALIEKLTYGGRDMPVFFLYELFRRIGQGFA